MEAAFNHVVGQGYEKISRSHKPGNGTAIDYEEGGHLRRIWTSEFTQRMCDRFNWDIMDLTDVEEKWLDIPAAFMRLVARKVG